MNSNYARLFKTLDGYARRHHECFLTELFLNELRDEYAACFRPLDPNKASLMITGCFYLRIGISEAAEMTRTGLLTVSTANILDEKLKPLSPVK